MKAKPWSFGVACNLLLAALLGIPSLCNAQLRFAEMANPPFEDGKILLSEYEDVDGDMDLDAMIIGQNSAGRFAKLLINDGAGNFTEKEGTPFIGVTMGAMAFADVDNDHDQDLLISGEAEVLRNTELYINDGNGNFIRTETNLEPMFYSTITFGDLDVDGDLDLYLSGYAADGSLSKLYLNNGNGEFTESFLHRLPPLGLGSSWFFDYDKDGDIDWLGTGRVNGSPKAYLMSPYMPNRYLQAQLLEGSQYGKSNVVDLDGDTFLDIFYNGSLQSGVKVAKMYLYRQGQLFTESDITEIKAIDKGDFEFYDLDGDNDLDLVVTGSDNSNSPSTILYLNDGQARFSEVPDMPFAQVSESTVKIADFNGDGSADIILTGKTDDGHSLSRMYLNQTFANTPPFVSEVSINGVAEVGQEVSLSYTFNDAEADADASTFVWYRADDTLGSNKSVISGATDISYVLTPLDEEKFLQAEVLPKDGINEGIKSESSWFGPITGKTPVIGLQGNFQNISPETNIPSLDDHTYFGKVPILIGMEQRSFTISNSGSAALEISQISIDGNHATDFKIGESFPQSVYPGEEISFSVSFSPISLGEKEARIIIQNNDNRRSLFSFNILGRGINNPPDFLSMEEYSFLENEELWQVDINANNGEGGASDEEIRYAIIGGEDQEFFTIDPDNGILSFEFTPDYESPVDYDLNNEYLVEISADDDKPENNLTAQTIRIRILDFDEDPVAECIAPFDIFLDVNGTVVVKSEDIDNGSTDDSGKFSMAIEPSVFSFQEVGPQEISLTVTDENNNTSICSTRITVRDTISPLALAKDIIINLDADGKAVISAEGIDDGSNDISGIASLSLDKTSFSCTEIGENEVILTVTDNNGNFSKAISIVTVVDVLPPVVKVSDISVYLDASGRANLTVEDINKGSSDACGAVNLSLDRTSFDCADVGEVQITMTGIDSSGNSKYEVATITVKDTIPPVVKVQNIVVNLDEYCRASITAKDVDNGSSDNCGFVKAKLDNTLFGCSQIGDNLVILTVEDSSGNRSSRTAVVTVVDGTGPLVEVEDLVVQLDDSGKVNVLPQDFDTGSSDACGDVSLTLNKSEFDCADLGENILLLTLMDTNGNSTETEVRLLVEDKTAPVIHSVQKNIRNINSAECSYRVSGEEFDIRVEDNCGIKSIINDYNNGSTLRAAAFPLGTTVVNWTISDYGGNVSTFVSEVEVINTAPVVSEIMRSETSVLANAPFVLWAEYKDENLKKAEWYFSSEGEGYDLQFPGVVYGDRVTGEFKLPSNVYKAKLVLEDDCGETTVAHLDYLTVYDPEGGFVTGGGWINVQDDLEKSKHPVKANFSINAKYRSGNKENFKVDGNSSFHFKAGGLNFKSTSYDDKGLAISGDKAIFKGVGTVNGSGKHKFLIVAIDGSLSQTGRGDGLRIQIMKDNSEEVLYDTHPFIAQNSDKSLKLGGGSIVIHKSQGNSSGKDTARGNGTNGSGRGKGQPDRAKGQETILYGTTNQIEERENNFLISPNPVEAKAEIQFSWGSPARATLIVFDFNGRELVRLFRGEVESNRIYRIDFNGENLQPGVYFCRLAIDTGEIIDKQLMVK